MTEVVLSTHNGHKAKEFREIFGADARTLEVSDSAALGGALLAARALETAK